MIIIGLVFPFIGFTAWLKHQSELAFCIWGLAIFQISYLSSILYNYRFDYTGFTKYWLVRKKSLHIPINNIDYIEYHKRKTGGWSRKAHLVIQYQNEKEYIILIKSRRHHYELLRLLHGCGVPIHVKIWHGHKVEDASQKDLDRLFSYD